MVVHGIGQDFLLDSIMEVNPTRPSPTTSMGESTTSSGGTAVATNRTQIASKPSLTIWKKSPRTPRPVRGAGLAGLHNGPAPTDTGRGGLEHMNSQRP